MECSSGESKRFACLIYDLPPDAGKIFSLPVESYFGDTA